jgi:hypothetical protein
LGASAVCDPKSLLFMFGMELDYSDALIGGGFAFQNPNATKTCGCGKSFATGKETENTATACNNWRSDEIVLWKWDHMWPLLVVKWVWWIYHWNSTAGSYRRWRSVIAAIYVSRIHET